MTVLEANGEADAGDIWATRSFPTRQVGKSSLYRHEVRSAAIDAIVEAITKVAGGAAPQSLDPRDPQVTGRARPLMRQELRAIYWEADSTDTVIRKIRAGEGHPGALDKIEGTGFHLFGAHPEQALSGRAGEIIAQRDGAICRATVDGAVWVTHLKRGGGDPHAHFKLPATRALALAGIELDVPEIPVPWHAPSVPAGHTSARSSTPSRRGWGTCTSTSTTAR